MTKTKKEEAFRAGFNAGMEYMAALEMGGETFTEEQAWAAYQAKARMQKRYEDAKKKLPPPCPIPDHFHVPLPASATRSPERDVYHARCILCDKRITTTGLLMALKKPDAWSLEPEF